MFKVKNRFKSESKIEKFHGLLYLLLWASVPTIIYFSFVNFQILNVYCFVGLGMYALFFATTLQGLVDYDDVKDKHTNSYERYKAIINVSRGSALYRNTKDESDERDFKSKSTDATFSGCMLFASYVAVLVSCIYFFVTKNFGFLALSTFNTLLMYVSYLFGGVIINSLEVSHLQLEEINEVTDLSTKEKNRFKTFLKGRLEKEKKITRADLYTIFKEINVMKKERELGDALKTGNKTESESENVSVRSGGTREFI